MAYNINNVSTAGKVTVFASFLGILAFILVFSINIKDGHFDRAEAQSLATTTVTVLNTPPQWTVDAQELYGSSTTTPTDAGNHVTWTAVGTDSNSERFYLLLCKTVASPTPNSNAAPTCDLSINQWAVSASTTSGTAAIVSTTTATSFVEINAWFAWICDGNTTSPRCNATVKQGSGTTSSPFEVNHRPVFTLFTDTSPALPGTVVTFYSTSSDADVSGSADTVGLVVCNLNDFSTSTNACGAGGTLASSTATTTSNASSTYTIVIPTQDQNYTAFGFIIDNHGFEATGGSQGTNSTLTVSNATPSVSGGGISLNGGTNMLLTNAATQTPNFTLSYTVTDNNSCLNAASTSEITGNIVSVFRSGIGSSTCSGSSAGAYNANNCYPNAVNTSVWNLSCTASAASCSGSTDTSVVWNCTFPLWYIADPTDGTATSTQYPTEHWVAAVRAGDDNFATSTIATSTAAVEVVSFLAFNLNTITIPYGSLEPGQQTDPIVATTTISATGNVGLDENLSGESMCTTYATGNDCPTSATSTIPESEQVYATSTKTYAQGVPLSSTTPTELELNVLKSTATSTQASGNTFWGIRVPVSITLAGSYKGENTFIAVSGESANW